MQIIPITVTNKIASVPCGTFIVADNTDYQLQFAFDEEWTAYDLKTCRFLVKGQYVDVDFTGSVVTIPSMPSDAYRINVGVFAGDLSTTTPAQIMVMSSVLATQGTEYEPAEPSVLPDVDELALDDTFVITDVSEGEKARANIGQIVDYVESAATLQPYDGDPEMDGEEASPGTSDEYARGDHVHPMPSASDIGAYELPASGIPSTDLDSGVNASLTKANGAVLFDNPQTLSDAQQTQARNNIGAASPSDLGTVFTVTNVSDLPATGNTVGDVYYVSSVRVGYIWLETTDHPTGYWEELGEPIDLSAYAPLASPAFTGTPTAPTAGTSTNNTQIATTAFVKSVLPSVPDAATATPSDLGTAAVGSSTKYAREDHVHNKPTYTASDVGALPSDTTYVSTVNGNSGAVTLTIPSTAADVGAEPAVTEVTVSSAGAVTQALDAGKLYHFTGALTALTITFNAASGVAQYHFDFVEGSTAFDPTLPSGVKLPANHTWEADTRYEVDILNNYAVVVGWAVS